MVDPITFIALVGASAIAGIVARNIVQQQTGKYPAEHLQSAGLGIVPQTLQPVADVVYEIPSQVGRALGEFGKGAFPNTYQYLKYVIIGVFILFIIGIIAYISIKIRGR